MAKLPRYDLVHNKQTAEWDLKNSQGRVVKSFDNKADATKGGALEKAVNGEGSVRIHKRTGPIQEERTFPRSRDPRGSKG
jgi:hypothetical protein